MMYGSHRQPPESWIELLDAYVVDMKARGLSDRTCETRWYQISSFARFIGKAATEVTGLDVSMWIADGDWSLQAKASRRAALMQFYRYLVRTDVMQNNPVETVPGIRRPRPIAKQPAPEEAVMHGLESADIEARLMVQLCSQVGLRREEISKVAASDIVAYGDGYALCVHGKGGRDRIVPISALLARDIQAKANGGWLFPGRRGGHCCVDHVYRVIKRATGWATHSFRRRFGRISYEVSGNNLRAIQELLGHDSPVTTQSYIFVPDANLREITEKVAQYDRHVLSK